MKLKLFFVFAFLFSFQFCFCVCEDFYEHPITVVITSYNNAKWYQNNLGSVFDQNYENYKVIYVDDYSPDGTADLVEQYVKSRGQEHRFFLVKNDQRMFKMHNVYHAIHQFCDDEDIVIELDGDDWLAHPHVFEKLNTVYADPDVWLTYGDFRSFPQNGKSCCEKLPEKVVQNGLYRDVVWCTSHLRTFYCWLFKLVKEEDFLYKGKFVRAATDLAQMFPMLEMSGGKFRFIQEILHIYNQKTTLSVQKKTPKLQNKMADFNRARPRYQKLNEHDLERLSLYKKAFGGWSIDKDLFNFIREILPVGATILEFGSGWASGKLSEYYTVYSVEHAKQWVGRYNTNYIYAPIQNGWYDVAVLQREMPEHYDLILVDSPPGWIGGGDFYKNLALFDTSVPIVFGNTNRKAESDLMINVANAVGREFSIFDSEGKTFGVIMPS